MSAKPPAYGGVVVDSDGRILLREPTGHYDGYVWTFSKGRPRKGETPEDAALRETAEETGVLAEIIARVPGTFAGGTTDNVYFLMRPTGRTVPIKGETSRVYWAEGAEKARELIQQTTNATGRARDHRVLDAALAIREGT
jgi:8-oxo-dGTP diphosphatase